MRFFECSSGVNYRHQFTVYIITFTKSKKIKLPPKSATDKKSVKTNIRNLKFILLSKVIIEKSRGEGSLLEQDTIGNVS